MRDMADEQAPFRGIRRLLPFTSIALLIALVYVGWVFFARWQANRDADRARREKVAQRDRAVLQQIGGSELKIVSFTATPAAVRAGERVALCYGVNNAKTVRIDPAVQGVWPALSRCVDVHPRRSTEYTITAEDAAGHSASEKLTVVVR
ncbi:MAG TPA: hypothetical protein VFA04_14835 [Bryobacteraceae bacterium]|nr:hypothetical protein [Bryobacteraceae bacterium]